MHVQCFNFKLWLLLFLTFEEYVFQIPLKSFVVFWVGKVVTSVMLLSNYFLLNTGSIYVVKFYIMFCISPRCCCNGTSPKWILDGSGAEILESFGY